MQLLLLDLDNTLVDRDAAFRAAVADFLAQHGLPDSDLTRVATIRQRLLRAARSRLG
ncbi:hypothetical protein EES39_31025 [Streptomyces sp. ADI92-24]|uniref:hypothetical protein n=1 Tax=unclassified Streptomyces TaxID=2593676 RepID=UPI000FAAAB12|nr:MULTISPECIES: hypothetical protein [unclassified Streptomyces]ROQ78351.1 hypothetical protein EDD95_4979 [Streptomyces sp. CEV 2-1]RPK37205.1 hypothetical protein EES39_31025 [Streptomyces sp. ADI92-24]